MSRWTGERIARLGFLIGLGWSAKLIAADPIVASTDHNVHIQASRYGLSFRRAKGIATFLPARAIHHFERAATKRGLSYDALIRLLLLEIAADPNLLDNILDFEPAA
jgi:hypothetical protein